MIGVGAAALDARGVELGDLNVETEEELGFL